MIRRFSFPRAAALTKLKSFRVYLLRFQSYAISCSQVYLPFEFRASKGFHKRTISRNEINARQVSANKVHPFRI